MPLHPQTHLLCISKQYLLHGAQRTEAIFPSHSPSAVEHTGFPHPHVLRAAAQTVL
jgi:hypothetical protein